MKKMPIRAAMLIATAALLMLGGDVAAQPLSYSERNVVTIYLVNEISLDDTVIFVDQIAKLSGGPIALRQRIARLDVAEFKLGANKTAIPNDQVKFRLMLAGFNESQFRITGARNTIVTETDEPVTARKILNVADQAMHKWNTDVGTPKDVIAPLLDLNRTDRVQYEARGPHPGATQLDVAILVNGKVREMVPVAFEVIRSEPKRTASEVRPAVRVTPVKEEPAVRTGGVVRIVVVVGSTKIVANGEAQQDGKIGDLIRVRNTDSNVVVTARIESRETVKVE
jgi:flagella basal body P-ring formation protein FlgA